MLKTATLRCNFRWLDGCVVVAVHLHLATDCFLCNAQFFQVRLAVRKLAGLDVFKWNAGHTGHHSFDDLFVAHFQRENCNSFALLCNVFRNVHCHGGFTNTGTRRKYDKFATVKAVCKAVETCVASLDTTEFARVNKTLVDVVHCASSIVRQKYKSAICATLGQGKNLFFGVGDCLFGSGGCVCLGLYFVTNYDKLAHCGCTLNNCDVLVKICCAGQQLVQTQNVVDIANLLQFANTTKVVNYRCKVNCVNGQTFPNGLVRLVGDILHCLENDLVVGLVEICRF